MPWIAALGAVAVTSFVLGATTGRGEEVRAVPVAVHARSPERAPVVVTRSSGDVTGAVREEVRAALRDELGRAAATEQDREGPMPVAAEVDDAAETAHRLLDRVADDGVMTIADRGQFHGLVGTLPRAQRAELLGRWAAAVNAQEIEVER